MAATCGAAPAAATVPSVAGPAVSTSHYIRTLTGLDQVGRNDALADQAAQASGAVPFAPVHVLHIGAQTDYLLTGHGVLLSASNIRLLDTDLVRILSGYLAGYHAADTRTRPTIAVATNSDGNFDASNPYTPAAKAQEWASHVVAPLQQIANGYGLSLVGGVDIEAGFSASISDATTWVKTYTAAGVGPLVTTGSLDNCPTAAGSSADCGPVTDTNGITKTWTRADYVNLLFTTAPGKVHILAQVFLTVQATQWANIDASSGHQLTFLGSLSEYAACATAGGCTSFTPAEANKTLRAALIDRGPLSYPTATDLDIIS